MGRDDDDDDNSAADQTRTDDPLVNSQLSFILRHAMNLLYHAELQRRTIERIQAQNKCLDNDRVNGHPIVGICFGTNNFTNYPILLILRVY